MTAIVLNSFGGMMPRYGDQLIPQDAASEVENALLLSGELRGLHARAAVADLRDTAFDIGRVYRIPVAGGDDEWVSFADETVDMVKGPLVNDAFDRYYITSENDVPRMNTRQRLIDGDPSYYLGCPGPGTPPTVAPQAGGITVTRAYTYTFVSAYGEESQPAPATIATGDEGGTWAITGMETTAPVPSAERNITHKNIYRTVTANNGIAEYHFVAQVDLATADYFDVTPTADVSVNSILLSEDWAPPPSDLQGIIVHPNGFLVGFTGRDIYFSEPYLPHAWPTQYILSTEDPIVGLGIFGTTIVITTRGFPYTSNGIRPDGISFTKAQTPEPCISTRRGIVSMPFGVYYPSDNGLVLVSAAGFINATQSLLTKDEWQNDYSPNFLRAARWQSQYVAFFNETSGFMFAPEEQKAAFVEIGNAVFNHQVFQEDALSGDVLLVDDNVVYTWNPPYGLPEQYKWVSKEIITAEPVNFGAFKVEFDGQFEVDQRLLDELLANNVLRFPYPLNPLGFNALNLVRKVETIPGYTPPPPTRQTSQAQHKSPLFTGIDDTEYEGSLILRLYADDELIYAIDVTDEELYRLPSGYKSKRWKVELQGNVNVKSVKIAETGKELATV